MVQEVVKSSKIHQKCPNLQIWMVGAATKNIMKVKAFAQILLGREVKGGIDVVFFPRGGKVSQIISSLYIESGQRRGFWRAIAKVYKTLSIKLMTIPTIEENHHPSRLTSDFGWSLTSFVPVTTQVFLLCLQWVDV